MEWPFPPLSGDARRSYSGLTTQEKLTFTGAVCAHTDWESQALEMLTRKKKISRWFHILLSRNQANLHAKDNGE